MRCASYNHLWKQVEKNLSASRAWHGLTDQDRIEDMNTVEQVRTLLGDALQLGERAKSFDSYTQLLGNLPELDSMAVVTVITAIEEHFGVTVHDDEISAETFETLGSLAAFVEQKVT